MNRSVGRAAVLAAIAVSLFGGAAAAADEPWAAVGAALGKSGAVQAGGIYRVPLPRTDLHATLDGVPLKAGFALGGWLAFAPEGAAQANAPAGDLGLDVAAIDRALGASGKVNGGVLQYSLSRKETIRDGGMVVSPPMGSAVAINFQPTGGGKAAITGDFVLTAAEVDPVLKALLAGNIEVTALHSHMVHEEPRLFFMHFWANDDVVNLAAGLRAALDRVDLAGR